MSDLSPPTVADHVPANRRGRAPTYDYDLMFDGELRVNRQGEQFHSQPRSFRGAVTSAAKTRNVNVAISIRGTVVYVQAFDTGVKPPEGWMTKAPN